ncbi:hypothetical protein Fuma_04132 [Fuerstiella marisgermanici]|uniref:Uncharacterized protein n=1 Tax=Fuerstiella marisgermanici TaxID=1891926 RepID=A0A1P8WKB3_9PLAN|nr:hypothetical protein Fuma_04132 [Fuerstiella marisgermanici]
MCDLSEYWEDVDRLHDVALRAAGLLSKETLVSEIDANPFAAELILDFREAFLLSVGAKRANTKKLRYRDWLKHQRIGEFPVAYKGFGTWAPAGRERAAMVSSARGRVLDAVDKYTSEVRFQTPNLQAWKVRLSKYAALHAKLGKMYSILGGILAVESVIGEIESMLVVGFPEVFPAHPQTFREFMGSRDVEPHNEYRGFCEGKTELEVTDEFLRHWQAYRVVTPQLVKHPHLRKLESGENDES